MSIERTPNNFSSLSGVVGNEITPEKHEEISKYLEDIRQEALRPIDGEIEKTEKELQAIELANRFIREITDELEIPSPKPLQASQVHILEERAFQNIAPSDSTYAFASIVQDSIYVKSKLVIEDVDSQDIEDIVEYQLDQREVEIEDEIDDTYRKEFGVEPPSLPENPDELNEEQRQYIGFMNEQWELERESIREEIRFEQEGEHTEVKASIEYLHVGAFMHEFLHIAAAEQFRYDSPNDRLDLTKSGYGIYYPVLPNENSSETMTFGLSFQSLNEAMTEKMARELLVGERGKMVQQLLGISHPFQEHFLYEHLYNSDMQLLDKILRAVANHRKEKMSDTWKRMKRGYFTGDMLHLRDIERAIGQGALRLYASIPAGDASMTSLFEKYMNTDLEKKRQGYSDAIFELGPHRLAMKQQREKYLRRHNRR